MCKWYRGSVILEVLLYVHMVQRVCYIRGLLYVHMVQRVRYIRGFTVCAHGTEGPLY